MLFDKVMNVLVCICAVAMVIMLVIAVVVMSHPFFGLGCMAINAVFDTDFQNPIDLLAENLGISTSGGSDAIGYNGPSVVRPGFIH